MGEAFPGHTLTDWGMCCRFSYQGNWAEGVRGHCVLAEISSTLSLGHVKAMMEKLQHDKPPSLSSQWKTQCSCSEKFKKETSSSHLLRLGNRVDDYGANFQPSVRRQLMPKRVTTSMRIVAMDDQCWGRDTPEGLQLWATHAGTRTSGGTVGDRVVGKRGERCFCAV